MERLAKGFVGVALTLLVTAAAHGQAIAPGRALVWPHEFSSEPFSCNALATARPNYMRISRPAFNCTAGIDCPQDLQEAPPREKSFKLFYYYVDKSDAEFEVTFPNSAVQLVQLVTEQLLQDMDNVARSKRRVIVVTPDSGSTGARADNERVGRALSQCVKNMFEVSMHLNGYREAYDFPVDVRRPDYESHLAANDAITQARSRRAEVVIRY